MVRGSPVGQLAQIGAFDIDALCIAGVATTDDLIDKAAVVGQIVEIAGASQQKRVLDGALEMAVRPLDGAVLMGDAGIVAGRRHAVMAA
jgi:hypothetical protein